MIGYLEEGTNTLRASGSWVTSSGYAHFYSVDCKRSGDSLTMTKASEAVIGDGSYEIEPLTIGSIWQIM